LILQEKGGKVNEMGCHHKLEQYLDEYIAAAGIAGDKKGPLFRAAIGRTGKLSERSMSRVDAWYMVRRLARDAGVETAIGNHSFRASVSRIIWNAAATLTSPSGWQATRTSKRQPRPSGLVLPGNQIKKNFEGERIRRITWKIVRGLHFHRTGKLFPGKLTVSVTLANPDEEPPKHFIALTDLPNNDELGHYPGVFAYRFRFSHL
jgi:hypothetical protein